MNQERTLTDADVKAILDAFEDKFYTNIGKGVWSIVWKAAIVALLAVASYGALHK